MIDDKTTSDSAQGPGDEAPGSVRGAARPAAKKATRKTAKKTVKKTVKKTAKKAGTASGEGRARKKRAAAQPAAAPSAAPAAAVAGTAAPATGTSSAVPPATIAPATAIPPASAPVEANESDFPAAAKRVPPADPPRRSSSMHPGARTMDTAPEDPGGLGGFLALWGPLIIVGFLVLVFSGGVEREATVASGHDAVAPASAMAPATMETGTQPVSAPALDPAGAVLARAFGEAGASPLPATSRIATAWTDSEIVWPAPPGPYRNPRARELSAGVGEWPPPAQGGSASEYGVGDDSRPRWVRCAAPYYWCPVPSSPAW